LLDNARLEVALGLETVHPAVLPALNKQMTLDDFRRAAEMLQGCSIDLRVFVLLRPPGLSEREGVDWALRSLEFAFDCGARVCSVIPVRGGNGIMDELQAAGQFTPPALLSLERVLEEGLRSRRGIVLADLWDVQRLRGCADCRTARQARLQRMNLEQAVPAPVPCACASEHCGYAGGQ
jgi:radical SAM enzyme (TIGR01210 family)